jgi:hypothetical protein
MKLRRLHPQRVTWEYVTAKGTCPGTCLACQLRHYCTRSRTGRTIHRHRDQALLMKPGNLEITAECRACHAAKASSDPG